MSRASTAMKANGAARPPAPQPDEFQMIPLLRISESAANPRKRFDSEKLAELAQSIREHGVIEPVIVRRNPMMKTVEEGASVQLYELICGARRFRASEMADKDTIPAMIREMDDKAVLEVMCIENANREDVHPLEEGEAFLKLVNLHGSSVHQLAEKIGKSERYVQRRLKLATLIPEAKEAYFDGKLTLEHYNLLARLEPSSQQQALPKAWRPDYSKYSTDGNYPPRYDSPLTAKDFEYTIRRDFFLSLKTAPWDKTDAKLYLAAGACANCTKRTGASPLLFDEADKADHCLDSACFDAKRKLHLVQLEKAAKKEGVELVRVATSYVSPADQKTLNCLPSYNAYEKVTKNNRCPHTQRAVVVVGDNVGAQFDICTNHKCKQHMAKPYGGSSAPRNANHDENRRKREIVEAVVDSVIKGILAKVPKKLERREWLLIAEELANVGHLHEAAELLGMDKLPQGYQAQQNAFLARMQAASESELGKAMVAMCLVSLRDECFEEIDIRLVETAKEFGVDVKAIEAQAKAAVAAKYAQEEKPVKGKASSANKQKKAAAAAGGDWDEDFNQEARDDHGF